MNYRGRTKIHLFVVFLKLEVVVHRTLVLMVERATKRILVIRAPVVVDTKEIIVKVSICFRVRVTKQC